MVKFINRVSAGGATLFLMQAVLPAARDCRAAAGRQLAQAVPDCAALQGLMAAPFFPVSTHARAAAPCGIRPR